ncbi:sensor histidine kinase [Parvularcula sp. IMCC14364]|uniref:sensor histidine kinase n=1 Tax=Parvularcula sp. IMCC14364 TaxID=3067902 RepID=UPI00274254DF|nr:ATP-binding protein [Parvularcula sp. IMCC14364]
MVSTDSIIRDSKDSLAVRIFNYISLFLICFFAIVLVVYAAERSMIPGADERLTDFRVASVSSFDAETLPDSAFEPIQSQWYSYRLPDPDQLYVMRTDIDLQKMSDKDYAFYITRARDRISVFLNGQPVGVERNEGDYSNVNFLGPRLYTLPDQFVIDGKNTIDIYLYGYSLRPRIYSVFAGEREPLVSAYFWRQTLNVTALNVVNGIGVFVAIFSLAVGGLSRQQRHEYVVLGLIMIFWVGRNVYYQMPMHKWDVIHQSLMFNITTFGLVMSIAAFANAWTAKAERTYRILAGIGLGYTGFSFLLDLVDTDWGDTLYLFLGLPVVVGALLWTGWKFITFRNQRNIPYFSIAAFGICLSTALVDVLSEILVSSNVAWWPLVTTMPYSPLAIVIVALGIIYVLARRTLQLRQVEEQQRVTLATELAERKAELALSYEKTREQEKQAAIAQERQRIMLDMHDGIGSQLLGLQLQIKQHDLSSEAVSDGLQTSLNDLRLIVDSLDTETDDIGMALGAFRARIQPQLSAAGVDLDWQMKICKQISGFGPEAVLHIYRSMQESVTNALRHSGMKRLTISMEVEASSDEATDQTLNIRITDDGRGIGEAELLSRRGLSHISKRAKALHGSATVRNTGNGTEIFLSVPIPPDNDIRLPGSPS